QESPSPSPVAQRTLLARLSTAEEASPGLGERQEQSRDTAELAWCRACARLCHRRRAAASEACLARAPQTCGAEAVQQGLMKRRELLGAAAAASAASSSAWQARGNG